MDPAARPSYVFQFFCAPAHPVYPTTPPAWSTTSVSSSHTFTETKSTDSVRVSSCSSSGRLELSYHLQVPLPARWLCASSQGPGTSAAVSCQCFKDPRSTSISSFHPLNFQQPQPPRPCSSPPGILTPRPGTPQRDLMRPAEPRLLLVKPLQPRLGQSRKPPVKSSFFFQAMGRKTRWTRV